MYKETLRLEEEDGGINHAYITNYIRSVLPAATGKMQELEEYAKEYHVPIVQPEVARFLEVMCSIVKPLRILEVGTAIGYSASTMYFASGTNPKVTTIERYDKMITQAKLNFEALGIEKDICLLEGDAVEIIETMDEQFDLIFLDAAKGQYPHFLKHSIRLLKVGGILLCDNVLYKGMIAQDELIIRRKRTIVKRLRSFIDEIMNHEELNTSLIPLGDGVTLSRKI